VRDSGRPVIKTAGRRFEGCRSPHRRRRSPARRARCLGWMLYHVDREFLGRTRAVGSILRLSSITGPRKEAPYCTIDDEKLIVHLPVSKRDFPYSKAPERAPHSPSVITVAYAMILQCPQGTGHHRSPHRLAATLHPALHICQIPWQPAIRGSIRIRATQAGCGWDEERGD
jgi:hypothetical protein